MIIPRTQEALVEGEVTYSLSKLMESKGNQDIIKQAAADPKQFYNDFVDMIKIVV